MGAPKKEKPVTNFGPWARFKSTENSGYSWFPFDVHNWLTSPIVNAMSSSEQGTYCRALATQWRDGSLNTDPMVFARQVGVDVRTARAFLSVWGKRVFTCLKHPNGGAHCDAGSNWIAPSGYKKAATLQQDRSKVATGLSQDGNEPEARLQQSCCEIVNGKLHFKALKLRKVVLPGSLEEKRREEEVDETEMIFKNLTTSDASLSQEDDDDELV